VEDSRNQFRNNPAGFDRKVTELRDENTDRLIENELILHEFETKINLPETVIDEYVQQRIDDRIHQRYGNRATLAKTLQAQGITYEKYRKQVRDQFVIDQMRMQSISEAVIISPHKIEAYYIAHTNDFKIEEQARLRMIVLNKPADDPGQARKLADEILTKLKDGAAFAEMAKVYSQDSKASQGGDWDYVERSVLRKELADAAFALQPGQTSDVIEMPEACYLLQVEDKRPSHIKPLSEVREDIEKTLLGQEQQRLQRQWVDRLKKKTFVRYFLK
jgi:peptidyl-prolyl cis-trans isomerase SurA